MEIDGEMVPINAPPNLRKGTYPDKWLLLSSEERLDVSP